MPTAFPVCLHSTHRHYPKKAIYCPFACPIAIFRAAAAPTFFSNGNILTRLSISANFRTILTELSFEQSSTINNSQFEYVCKKTEFILSPIKRAALYDGIIMETKPSIIATIQSSDNQFLPILKYRTHFYRLSVPDSSSLLSLSLPN